MEFTDHAIEGALPEIRQGCFPDFRTNPLRTTLAEQLTSLLSILQKGTHAGRYFQAVFQRVRKEFCVNAAHISSDSLLILELSNDYNEIFWLVGY